MPNLQLSQLIDVESPEAIWKETQTILALLSPDFDIEPVATAWETAVALYDGRYPGYQACNTPYHDFNHIADVFLALTRLIHGAALNGQTPTNRNITLALIAALFHDSGLIQTEDDTEGTGAKYLADHDQRSMALLERFAQSIGWTANEIAAGRFFIGCTDLSKDVAAIVHPHTEIKRLGQLLAAADLIAQMADRTYLEKLLYLYHEFKEGKIGDYANELDLLQKTVGFHDFVVQRLAPIENMIDQYAKRHFMNRWQIDANLYTEAISRQMLYLQDILEQPGDPRDYLKRQDIVRNAREFYKSTGDS
ncbi:MAG: hypothetical protein GY803_22990 [Chloroflexi bacterium]|nr:hypothetical protein [Chloroflexota bacterium]